jgi:hypothetical protein
MTAKQNLTRLSSRFLGSYRWVLFLIYTIIFGMMLFSVSRQGILSVSVNTLLYGYGYYWLLRLTNKLQHVAFDEAFLYVFKSRQDIIIPLENIESIEISTLGGVYKVNLYHAEQLGDHFYFKTSLLYPLNFRKMDERVNELRNAIGRAKSRRQHIPGNALRS